MTDIKPDFSVEFNVYRENRNFSAIDWEFGDMIARRANGDQWKSDAGADLFPTIQNALRLLSAQTLASVRNSNNCLDLKNWCNFREMPENASEENPDFTKDESNEINSSFQIEKDLNKKVLGSPLSFEQWREIIIKQSDVFSDDLSEIVKSPFVVVPDCENPELIFLRKYRDYEKAIASFVKDENKTVDPDSLPDEEAIYNSYSHKPRQEGSAPLSFSQLPPNDGERRQISAIQKALGSNFMIITGGPGTGKTTVLAVELAWELKRNPNLRIALCAPTGKAAARMKESIIAAVDKTLCRDNRNIFTKREWDNIESILKSLTPCTIHRLIGLYANSASPRFGKNNPLPFDMIVIDECSMASLQIFKFVTDTIAPKSRLLLLGDEFQLTSVESGTVLADLCAFLNANPSMNRHIETLTMNFRSKDNLELVDFAGGIVRKPENVNCDILYKGQYPNFKAQSVQNVNELENQIREFLTDLIVSEKASKGDLAKQWAKISTVEQAFEMIDKFKILCAVREGDYGIYKINEVVRSLLNINGPANNYANGTPIMITKNDKVTGLNNGDIGVCFEGKVYFPASARNDHLKIKENNYRVFSPAQLSAGEYAFAMTIHKSQGSDYPNVLMILPDKDNQVLSRELIYTGITRTKKRFSLIASREILETALARPTKRSSGLKALLCSEN